MSKYEMLNDCKIDVDSIQEIKQSKDQNNKIFDRVKSRVVFKNKKPKSFKKTFAAIALAAVACIGIFVVYDLNKVVDKSGGVSKTFEFGTISITPTKQMAKGVAIDTEFIITTQQDTTLQDIEKNITISPKREYEINEVNENEYKLKTSDALNQEEVINILVQDEQGRICKSWAFQTEGMFRILDSYPADKEEYVSDTSGIELTFSDSDVSENEIKSNVIIEPSIEYTLEKYNSTFIIIPSQLEKGEVYKVTVRSELENGAGQQLNEDYNFEFKTQLLSKDSFFYFGINGTHTYTTNDIPAITVMSSDNKEEYVGTLYQFTSIDDFQEMVMLSSDTSWNRYTPDVSGMTIVQSFDIAEYVFPAYDTKKVVLPNKLSKGYYILAIYAKDSDSIIDYKIIQITDLSVYITSDEDSTLVWVNDSETGKSVEDAHITIDINSKKHEMNTDSEGKAIFTGLGIVNDTKANIIVTTDDNKIFSDLITNNTDYSGYDSMRYDYDYFYFGYRNMNKDYYMYMYTDRGGYMPSDTVKVWGVIRPRNIDKTMPSDFSIVMQKGYYDDSNDLYTLPIEISKDGIFTAEIPYEDLMSGMYNVYLKSELGIMYSRSINIEEYIKPIYVIDAMSDKEIYTDYENVDIGITSQIRLYDGSPASDLTLKFNLNSYDEGGTTYTVDQSQVVTDESGTAEYKVNFVADNYSRWYPTLNYYSIVNDTVGNEEISTYGQFYVVFRDVMLTTISKEIGDKLSIDINTNIADYSKIASSLDMPNEYEKEYDSIRGKAFDTSIRASVKRSKNEKVSLGFEYDPIYNENVEKFSYNHITEYVGDFEINTKGGKATFDLLPAFKEDEYNYEIKYYYTDSRGRQTMATENYFNESAMGYGNVFVDKYSFKTSESVFDSSVSSKFELVNNYTNPVVTEGTLLYYTISEQINNISVTTSKNIEVEFSEELVPNYYVTGAYFDGTHVYQVEDLNMRYDSKEKEVNIEIKTDKDKYVPSEKASVAVRVLDKKNNPIPNAKVCISIVDEALFALAENEYDILTNLYQRAYINNTLNYLSYIPNDAAPGWGAEGGGGDGDTSLRTNFKDTAAFETVVTDEKGYATINIKLPDDITSWRITALAITDDLRAGSTKDNIIVTRDIYINAIINTQFIVGDDIAVSLRTNGENAKKGDKVDYEVKISDGNTSNDIITKVTSKIGFTEVVSAGKLPAGDYTITISTATKEYADAIQKQFRVVESGINAMIFKEFNLKNGIDLNAKLYPVGLTFYNSEYSQYQSILNDLSWNNSIRKDEKLAQMFVKDTFEKMGEENNWITKEYTVSDLVEWDGGVGDLDASNSSPEFTARLCAAYPEFFAKSGTKEYLTAILFNKESTKNQVAAAYMGLAALKQPVLYDIKYLLEQEGMDTLSRLYLVAGLSLIGDTDLALSYYLSEIQPNISNFKGTADEKLYYTAIASITSSVLNTDDNEQIIKTLISTPTKQYLLLAERMVYIKYFKPATEGDSSFEYTIDGKVISKTMNKLGYTSIQVSKDQFENLDIKQKTGNVDVMARYIGAVTELNDTKNQEIQVEKTITSISPSEYRVNILFKTPKEVEFPSFIVDDYIPSGARFSNVDSIGDFYLENQEMQRIRFLYSTEKTGSSFSISYTIRMIVPGEYTMERTVVNSTKDSTWGISDTGKVRIGE